MTKLCASVGNLVVGGVVVGLVKCGLEAGHEIYPATPHVTRLEWDDSDVVDWPESLDPDEAFDVPVELRPDDAPSTWQL